MLILTSDIGGSGKIEAAAIVFPDDTGALLDGKKATVCEVLPRLDAAEVFSGHVSHFLSALYEKYLLYEICWSIRLCMWSSMRRNRLYLTDSKILLSPECGRLGVLVERSKSFSEWAKNGMLACRNVEERDAVGSHYGSPAYGDLRKDLQVTKR